jgi:probable HAF family extracellular repeat protein
MVSLRYGSISGRSVSGDGAVIVGLGGSETNANMWAFRTRPGYLSTLSPTSALWDISDNGLVAVGEQNGRAMYINDASATAFAFGSDGSRATGVSADGSVIVGEGSTPSFHQAFVRTATGITWLGDFANGSSVNSQATAVSPDGQIVVGKAALDSNSWAGFRWTQASGMTNIGKNFLPKAVTDQGMIVGETEVIGSSLGDGHLRLLLENCGLDLTGWNLSAHGLTPDGKTIVGAGTKNFEQQAVLIRLP